MSGDGETRVERPLPRVGQPSRITELWVWTALDPMTDVEGIVAAKTRDGGGIPLVTMRRDLADRLRVFAEEAMRTAEEPRPVLQLRRFVSVGRPVNCNCSWAGGRHDELCPARTTPRFEDDA